MGIIDEIQAAVEHVSGEAGGSIVGIGSRQRGSGVVIAAGRVLTNAHNIRGERVTVTFADGRRASGVVAGIDVDGDLAVVDVDTSDARPLGWADSIQVRTGTVVFGAAAAPGGGVRITLGTVSAVARAFRGPRGRRISGSIEHTAPLAPGSSGGAVLDAGGRFLALNTNRLGEGFYLAIPADAELRERAERLGRGEHVERPRLGVAVVPAEVARRLRRSVGLPDRDGLLVRGVDEDSPAARAGIAEGDLLVEVDGHAVTDLDSLADAIARSRTPYEVRLVRGAEELTVTIEASGTPAGDAT
jgi:serine protease Do